ncbi:hypothetical protein BDV10DRAFT_170646 [Aspergillus recurvatus]
MRSFQTRACHWEPLSRISEIIALIPCLKAEVLTGRVDVESHCLLAKGAYRAALRVRQAHPCPSGHLEGVGFAVCTLQSSHLLTAGAFLGKAHPEGRWSWTRQRSAPIHPILESTNSDRQMHNNCITPLCAEF